MTTAAQHIQKAAMDDTLDLLTQPYSEYNRRDPESVGFKYRDDFVIIPTDQSLCMWALKDVFGKEYGRFTSKKLAKEFADRRMITQKQLEERKTIEREEREREEFNKGNT